MSFQTPAPEAPFATEVEQALIGAVLYNNKVYDQIPGDFTAAHFHEYAHQLIWNAISNAIESGVEATPITLAHQFRDDPALKEVGGSEYLVDLATAVLAVTSARDYANTLIDLHQRREAHAAVTDAQAELAQDHERPASAIMNGLEERLDTVRGVTTRDDAEHFSMPSKRMLDEADKAMRGVLPPGVQTGLIDLDGRLGGLHKGDLCYLGGRPGMGKTALATGIAMHVADTQGAVLFATMEMTAEQLTRRMASSRSLVEYRRIRSGKIEMDEFKMVAEATRAIDSMPLYILDRPGLTLGGLRAAGRRLKRKEALRLLIVDYLGLMGLERDIARRGRYEQIGYLSRGMKNLAKILDIPILCLLQLSRQVEARDNPRPVMSDLRDSGELEQDADQVLFTYRQIETLRKREPTPVMFEDEDAFHEAHAAHVARCSDVETEGEVIIGKNRHGSPGLVKVYFDGSTMTFGNAARQQAA